MLPDHHIRAAVEAGEIKLEPFEPACLQPASYDLRIGSFAFSSAGKEKTDLRQKGVLMIEAGEFAVVEVMERVELSTSYAAQLGLRSEYARRGLQLLSGPQVDPGWGGTLVVRLVNLSPRCVPLGYGEPFLTTQFFRLAVPAQVPYRGPRQAQTGITAADIQELMNVEGMTLGQVVKTLSALAHDVAEIKLSIAEMKGSISRLTWTIPLIVAIGMAVLALK